MEDELAAGGGGVDRLLQAAEPHAAISQPGAGVDQVAQGAAEDGAVGRAPLAVSVNTR